MIKVKAIMDFTLARFGEITNLTRANQEEQLVQEYLKNKRLAVGDTFECSKDLADYLTGGNSKGLIAVEILEVIPEEKVIMDLNKEQKQKLNDAIENKVIEMTKETATKPKKKTSKK